MKVPMTRGKRVTVLTYDGGTCLAPALVLSNDGKRATLLIHKTSGFVIESISAKSDYVGRPTSDTSEQAYRELSGELMRLASLSDKLNG